MDGPTGACAGWKRLLRAFSQDGQTSRAWCFICAKVDLGMFDRAEDDELAIGGDGLAVAEQFLQLAVISQVTIADNALL
jgi:hypothetical protein